MSRTTAATKQNLKHYTQGQALFKSTIRSAKHPSFESVFCSTASLLVLLFKARLDLAMETCWQTRQPLP